jgi:hypothetical protein
MICKLKIKSDTSHILVEGKRGSFVNLSAGEHMSGSINISIVLHEAVKDVINQA